MSEHKQILEALQQISKQLEAISKQLEPRIVPTYPSGPPAPVPVPLFDSPWTPENVPWTVPSDIGRPIWIYQQTVASADGTGG